LAEGGEKIELKLLLYRFGKNSNYGLASNCRYFLRGIVCKNRLLILFIIFLTESKSTTYFEHVHQFLGKSDIYSVYSMVFGEGIR
jgi:hypothetical protein